jgi:hypothetical protein
MHALNRRIKRLPLWLRYLCAFGLGAILLVALVLYVHHNQGPLVEPPSAPNQQQAAAENGMDVTIVKQQQAPHVVKLVSGNAPIKAASSAVTTYMSTETKHALIAGPLDGTARCTAHGGSAGREAFHCLVVAGHNQTRLNYPFDAVVDTSGHTVTYCQVVTAPSPSMKMPALSAACT